MIKRILAGAAAAAVAATLLASGSASAAPCPRPSNTAPSTGYNDLAAGVRVYRAVGPSGGYVGVTSGSGFVEGNGTPNGGGNGHVAASINGSIYAKVGSESPTVCANGTPADAPA